MFSPSGSSNSQGPHLLVDGDFDDVHGAGLHTYAAPCAELGFQVDVHGHAVLHLVNLLPRHRVDGEELNGIDRAGDDAVTAAGAPFWIDVYGKRHRYLRWIGRISWNIFKMVNIMFLNYPKNLLKIVNLIFFDTDVIKSVFSI
jgi:hypothetical protein